MPEEGEPRRRVLVVDDQNLNHRLLARLLERLECEAVPAYDGVEAVEAWSGERFDLVILDVHMPRLGGPGAAREILRLAAEVGLAPPRLVALTATAEPQDVDECLAAGMEQVLAKPPSLDALRAMLAGPPS